MLSTRRNSNQTLRSDVAQAAARLVADGEAANFATAKRKAVDALGLENFRNMPENQEVHDALMLYQRLFEGAQWIHRIDAMRREARTAMIATAQFRPRLVGPVLYGSACEHSPVTIHLYTDELESVTRFFHEAKINYRLTHTILKTGPSRREEFPCYVIINDGLEFNMVVFGEAFFAHPPLSSLNGRPYKRADVDALDKLIEENSAAGTVSSNLHPGIGGS